MIAVANPRPETLADEIRRERGAWYVYAARFTRSFPSDSSDSFAAWINIIGPTYSADVEQTARSSGAARLVRAALRRAGYSVGTIRERRWSFGRRPLHGMRELAAEIRHLEALVDHPEAVERFPRRAVRPSPIHGGNVPERVVDYLRQSTRWVWSMAAVERRGVPEFLRHALGWHVVAWCSLLTEPGEEPHLDVGVQLFRADGDVAGRSAESRRVKAAVVSVLEPDGYRLLPQRGGLGRSDLFLLERRVRGLADARRARARIDRLLFDRGG